LSVLSHEQPKQNSPFLFPRFFLFFLQYPFCSNRPLFSFPPQSLRILFDFVLMLPVCRFLVWNFLGRRDCLDSLLSPVHMPPPSGGTCRGALERSHFPLYVKTISLLFTDILFNAVLRHSLPAPLECHRSPRACQTVRPRYYPTYIFPSPRALPKLSFSISFSSLFPHLPFMAPMAYFINSSLLGSLITAYFPGALSPVRVLTHPPSLLFIRHL